MAITVYTEWDGRIVIDHAGPTPLYVQVADAVQARIEAGDLLPNRPIPSENQLVQEYGVARGTARKSIQLLRERGLVVTVVGRGTYVVARPSTREK
ncbi:GntR family transcriptional regulator [Krasilnikovia sp. M28-CT-15]|uniref:GntR family transcriptional regulator n=1 Tax=Krasilnikovia sp. M28-CT-15 TaxID=3373540 RepID=UPI003875D6FF